MKNITFATLTAFTCILAVSGTAYGMPTDESKIYNIRWQKNSSKYITEQADGNLVVENYSTANKMFWEFIPTENENCYYIRNTTTGHYIGSCNLPQSSSSKITVSEQPQEYYLGGPVSTSAANDGCFWLSSTDCPNYNKSDGSTGRGLNMDGNSQLYVISYYTGLNNVGSYWTLEETEDLYEVRPFSPSSELGKPSISYHILNIDGKAYDVSGIWVDLNPLSKSQHWYFVGNSNADGGYQIVNSADNTSINKGATYKVKTTQDEALYNFFNETGILSLGDETDFTFIASRSEFALNNQIYKMPCGSVGDVYITSAEIGRNLRYPMATYSNNKISTPTASKPSNKYVFLTRDSERVTKGSDLLVNVALNKEPGAYKVLIYCDWDRDGYFEYSKDITTSSSQINTELKVPEEAKVGKTRIRIRVTDNGLPGADDDTHGEVLDLLLKIDEKGSQLIDPEVKVNDPRRGTAVWENGVATAKAKGKSLFLYWGENLRVISVDEKYEIAASEEPRTLTAYFSPIIEEISGIDETLLQERDEDSRIVATGSEIKVMSSSPVKLLMLFSSNGMKIASIASDSLSLQELPHGVYIAKAITENGTVSAKIKI